MNDEDAVMFATEGPQDDEALSFFVELPGIEQHVYEAQIFNNMLYVLANSENPTPN